MQVRFKTGVLINRNNQFTIPYQITCNWWKLEGTTLIWDRGFLFNVIPETVEEVEEEVKENEVPKTS